MSNAIIPRRSEREKEQGREGDGERRAKKKRRKEDEPLKSFYSISSDAIRSL